MKNIVYLILESNSDPMHVKIGITEFEKLNNRIKNLQTSNPNKLILLESFRTKYASKIEKLLHKIFSYKKLNGEWFEFDYMDIEKFKVECVKLDNNFKSLEENPFFIKINEK